MKDATLLRVKHYKVIGAANEYTLEHHCGQQSVFLQDRNVSWRTHWCGKRDAVDGAGTDPHFLRWQVREGLLCFADHGSALSGSVQDAGFPISGGWVEKRTVSAGIQLKPNLPASSTGEMNRDHQAFHEWQFLLGVVRRQQRDVLTAYTLAQPAARVETELFVPVVDEQIKVCQEIFAEQSSNAVIGGLDLWKVLDYGKWLLDHVPVCFQATQDRHRRLRITGNGNDPNRPHRLEV